MEAVILKAGILIVGAIGFLLMTNLSFSDISKVYRLAFAKKKPVKRAHATAKK